MVVLGMHRSGTSMVVRALETLGLFAGDESDFHPGTEHDPAGHREHVLVWKANETALAAVGRAWDDPVGIDWGLLDEAGDRDVNEAIGDALAALAQRPPWVMKDPRLCVTLPLWRRAISPICVMTHRDPLEIARSLAARDGTPVFAGLALWEFYQRAALVNSIGLARIFTSFDALVANPDGFGAWVADRLRDASPGLELTGQPTRPALFSAANVRERSTDNEVTQWLNPAQRRLLDAVQLATMGAPDGNEAIAASAAEPVSTQATEMLTTLARQRHRITELERRVHEISRWNEHLQSQLDSSRPTP